MLFPALPAVTQKSSQTDSAPAPRNDTDERLRLFEHALNHANTGVLIADAHAPDMPIVFANRAATRITGYSEAELLGRNCRFLQAHDRDQPQLEVIRAALREATTCDVVLRNYKKDGTMFWNEVRIAPVLNAAGQVTHFVGFQNDISARKEAEAQIAQSLREKEVMLKEIHHRVKNNMQIVSSLLNLQLEYIAEERIRAMFVDAQSRIASMALVHEKLYQSRDLGRVNFSEYVRDLVDNLIGAQGGRAAFIRFELQTEELYLGIDTAIPCGLLINELVSNAYKHAFPEGARGTIKLSLSRTGADTWQLEISDDGNG